MTCVSKSFAGQLRQVRRLHQAPGKSVRAAFSVSRFWCAALVMVAGTISLATQANAATFYSDDDGGYAQPVPIAPPRAQKPKLHTGKASAPKIKEAAKPQGPLII